MPITFMNITVPFFPAKNDNMMLIRGDDPDPWVAKVLTIQEWAKTVRVLYYMKDEDKPGQEFTFPIVTLILHMTLFYGIVFWVDPMESGRKMYLNLYIHVNWAMDLAMMVYSGYLIQKKCTVYYSH